MVIRIIKKTGLWLVLIAYMVVVFGFVSNRYEKQLCNSVKIRIADSSSGSMVTAKEIMTLVNSSRVPYLGLQLGEVNLPGIEQEIITHQTVKDCKAYIGINGVLNIEIKQRTPLVRIIDKSGNGYYLDSEGNIVRLSSHYAPRVLVVNGNIFTPFHLNQPVNIFNMGDAPNQKRIKEIFELATYITDSKLWNAQIEQVYVNKMGEFELVPRVGPHLILLGSIEDYEEKLNKLEIFYREGLNNVGWNKYSKINLKFKDQVVCTKI